MYCEYFLLLRAACFIPSKISFDENKFLNLVKLD